MSASFGAAEQGRPHGEAEGRGWGGQCAATVPAGLSSWKLVLQVNCNGAGFGDRLEAYASHQTGNEHSQHMTNIYYYDGSSTTLQHNAFNYYDGPSTTPSACSWTPTARS